MSCQGENDHKNDFLLHENLNTVANKATKHSLPRSFITVLQQEKTTHDWTDSLYNNNNNDRLTAFDPGQPG